MGKKLHAAQGPDRVLLIAGFLFLVATFLPWFRVRIVGFGTASGNAWNIGGLGQLAALFGIATLGFGVVTITGILKPNPSVGLVALVLAGGTLLFTFLRFVFKPGGDAEGLAAAILRSGLRVTRGIGLWAALVLAVIMAVAGFQKYVASDA
jgi:hypothetical protein